MLSVQKIRINSDILRAAWQEKNNCIAFEMSELSGSGIFIKPAESIIVINTTSGNSKTFVYKKTDTDGSNEDVYGWRYESGDGLKLLLIND